MKTVWALLMGAILLITTQALAQPDHAANIVIKHLGQRLDPQTRRLVDGYAIIDYKKGHAKPDHAGGPKNNGGSTSSCFTPLAKGATWAVTEPYIVDTDNDVGLEHDDILAAMSFGAAQWNAETYPFAVFGAQSYDSVDHNSIGVSMNTHNEVDFRPINEPGVIAVTYVWGIFYGPPSQRILSEWDMRFNTNFAWGTDGDGNVMDLLNIAAHELGHALGLGHPENTCTEETMYAYATEGETKKRDLHDGDIAGAQELY
jgi:hypothetical protein